MSKNASPRASAGGVQVFELTMDNAEDQDELNRLLRKPGESGPCQPPETRRTAGGASAAEPTGKKRGKRKGKF
jgi:hypothetical protein